MTALPWLESGPVALMVRASAILIVAFALHRSLRGASALSRHALWSTVMIGLLALPLLQVRLPRLGIPGWRAATPSIVSSIMSESDAVLVRATTEREASTSVGMAPTVAPNSARVGASDRETAIPWHVVLILGWCVGGMAVLVPIVVGMRRARQLVAEAIPVYNRRMLVRLEHLRRVTGVRRHVTLGVSERVRTPMAWGYRRPAILLPMDAADWTADRFDAVLVHELVHIRRGDTIHQAIARLASACYWFHPFVWEGSRLAAAAREQACDDAVLRFGTRPSHYARHLIELAEHGTSMTSMPALARLHHPNLEDRVMTILQHAPSRQSPWRAAFAIAVVSTWTLAVAAIGPVAAQQPAPPVPPVPPVVSTVEPSAPPSPAKAPRAPVPPLAVPTAVVPAMPAAPPAPAAPVAPDCTRDRSGGVTARSGDGQPPVRLMQRDLDDGRSVCMAIRGRVPEEFSLSPLGRLPVGVVMTLQAHTVRATQRLVITGAASGNTHEWSVNGQQRTFDTDAKEWRDAMLDVFALSWQQARVHGTVASLRGELAAIHGEDARMKGEVASVRGRIAADRVRELQSVIEARRADLVEAQATSLDADRARLAEHQELLRREAAELESQAAALADQRHAVVVAGEGVVASRRAVEARVADLAEVTERMAAVAEGRQAAAVASDRDVAVASGRIAELRTIERRRGEADIEGRVQGVERRLQEFQGERKVAELEARLAPLEQRLRAIIDRIGSR